MSNQHNFTAKDEAFAKAMAKDQEFRMTVLKFIQRIDPTANETDTEALDMYAYGIALKLTTLERFHRQIGDLKI